MLTIQHFLTVSKHILPFCILLLVTMSLMAQKNIRKYDELWKKVDVLINEKGLPKSALKEVNRIYELAKKEKEEAQLIKALLYRIDLGIVETDDAVISSINSLEKEIGQSKEPVRSILASITAEYYWNYFGMNRWKLYNRTDLSGPKKNDIATWGITDFHQRIGELYLLSVKEEKLLQQTALTAFDPIIVRGNSRRLRPTLFDLLANRALAYFKNDERELTRPAYAFKIDQEEAFAPATAFVTSSFPAADSTSLQRKALLIYQRLIAFHQSDKDPAALIDIDIDRLEFVRQASVLVNKEELYYNAVKQLAGKYPKYPEADRAWYLMAQWHADKAAGYEPLKDTTSRYAYVSAHKICEQVLSRNDSSEGAINCYNLLQEIEQKQLTHITEKVNVPGQPFRVLVNYRNCFQVYARIIPIKETERDLFDFDDEDKYWKKLVALKPLRQWTQSLPETRDYQPHSAEIPVEALPIGEYALLLGGAGDFNPATTPLSIQSFYVSNIGYVNNRNEYFVLHRQTGKPLVNAAVQVWKSSYDYKLRKTVNKKAEKLVTDDKGYFRLTDSAHSATNIRLEIDHEKDHLFIDENTYVFYNTSSGDDRNAANFEKLNSRAFLFTDRAIYRPGQTVYFKGIALTKDFNTRKSKILTGQQTTLVLRNTSGEKVDSLVLTTNSFGSYTGSFRLAENMLNGQFSIHDITHSPSIQSRVYFRVEEYKRPAFYVDYEKVAGTYRVNDSITVTGTAQAYAGNNIDGAQVRYRVVRQPRFIYYWLFKGRGMPATPAMEMAQGTSITGPDGKFTVRFKAIPDESLNRSLDPVFDYRIIADVTDINGETRTAETTVSVSYKALQLSVQLPGNGSMPLDSLRAALISTMNMNGVFEPSPVTVQIYPLVQPDRLIRYRYWQEPDQFIMSKEEYTTLFPHDEYSNESHKENWLRGKLLTAIQGSSDESRVFTLPVAAAAPGWYAIEVSATDKFGETVKDIQYVLLYDEKSNRLPAPEYISSRLSGNSFEPGDKALLTLGSAAKDITVIQQITKTQDGRQEMNEYRLFSPDNEQTSIELPVKETDRGGIEVNFFFVKDNRFYLANNFLPVPWSNKMLSISYETYRDKTLPGSEETWKVKISGSKKEKVAAEMLASLYDASLDQFVPHEWHMPSLWSVGYPTTSWKGNSVFTSVSSVNKGWMPPQKITDFRRYDALNTFYSLLYNYGDKIYGARSPISGRLQGVVAGVQTLSKNELNEMVVTGYDASKKSITADASAPPEPEEETPAEPGLPETQIRQNFNETAFFLPSLETDAAGNIAFSFTMPEALTRWKFQALAHTRDLAFGYTTTNLVTQKDLMVQPNAPRFLREGDRMELTTKIVNLSDHEITGTVHLELLNAATLSPVDGIFGNSNAHQYFTIEAGQSVPARFSIEVPYHYNEAVIYRFVAKAEADSKGNSLSDGEEAALPVLTNRMLVTETLPLSVRGNREKQFELEKLLHSDSSETLQHHALTVEFSSNPAWYAVQALPYLMEYPYECAEQVFNRFYANALASKIVSTSPRIAAIFEQWKTADTAALLSNLQKNPELKSILLEETPWVLEARSESQQKKNIALLFDLVKMKLALESSLDKLTQMQSPNGGFVWFKGGPDDRYITQYILTGIGHLKQLDALPAFTRAKLDAILKAAFPYTDSRLQEDYDIIVKSKSDLSLNNLGGLQIQFLYMRSFFPEAGIPGNVLKAVSYYRGQSQRHWVNQNNYMKGMIALQLYRTGDKSTAAAIMKSLQENAITSDELGMYWKGNQRSYFWQDAPIETHSLLTEAFAEIIKDHRITDNLKTWLLKNKQTNNWGTTKASAEACYALLLEGTQWVEETPTVTIKLGDRTIASGSNAEAGTGYFKTRIEPPFIQPELGRISVQVNSGDRSTLPTWGAVYWQYFEQLDKITPAATPLSLSKQLFIERNSDRGPQLQPVTDDVIIKTGDRIKVRIELRVDRDMEYVHLKDMRASCMEPVNVLSGYRWQGGLGYYESTKDAGTHFFFSRLPRGTYVFEYPLLATMPGNFSNGVTSIQCMYAPEFSSHSEGIRVRVE